MRIAGIVVLASVLFVLAAPSVAEVGPFERHMRDALRLNKSRYHLYSALTSGASEKVSDMLIERAWLAQGAGRIYDTLTARYRRAGVPLGSEDLLDMSEAPAFGELMTGPDPLFLGLEPVDGRAIVRGLKRAYEAGGFSALEERAEKEIARFAPRPRYHCMVRHLLESVRRVAHLAPKHDALARSKGMKSCLGLSWRLVQLHFIVFSKAAEADELAAPIQAKGVPIIVQDVPAIGIDSAFYDR